MAPYKFEENIREKFEAREIEPSKNAWEKLSAQLPAETKKNNSRFIWMAVAASFVGILILASFLFNDKVGSEKSDKNNNIVENSVKSKKENNFENEAIVIADNQNEVKNIKTNSEEEMPQKIVSKANISEEKKEIATTQKEKSNNTEIAILKTSNQQIVDTNKIKPNGIEQLKIDEVVASIQKLKAENSNVSVVEIDSLLAKAQRDIRANRIFTGNSAKFDAASLLQDAEIQLDRTFRDRVFTALGDGFQKIKTAYVERNQ